MPYPTGRSDLLVEAPGCERLATWRLERNPLGSEEEIPAQRIGDHRRLYLAYEGELSGGRGRVRRTDAGDATIEQLEGERLLVVLEGRCLRGRFEMGHTALGPIVFRRSQKGSRPAPPFRV